MLPYSCHCVYINCLLVMEPEISRFFNEVRNILETPENLNFLMNTHGCVIWTGPNLNKSGVEYGYKYVKLPNQNKKSRQYTHRLAYMFKIGNFRLPRGLDVSHICHNSLCVNPAHLSSEPHHINNNRIQCVNEGRCFGHQQYKTCLLN